jgi:transglutaminase-like putative cysteine protease
MRYHVFHETKYIYDSIVTLSQQMLHMTPRNSFAQVCEQNTLTIHPQPTERVQHVDYFKNYSDYIAVFTPHKILKVSSSFTVTLKPRMQLSELEHSLPWNIVAHRLMHEHGEHLEAVTYLYTSPSIKCSQALADYARPSFWQGRPLIETVFELSERCLL